MPCGDEMSELAYVEGKEFVPKRRQQQQQRGTGELYKTELCKTYQSEGACPYGRKCQFAHGKDEIRVVSRHPLYKTAACKSYRATGSCRYGDRCRFIHEPREEAVESLPAAAAVLSAAASETDLSERGAAERLAERMTRVETAPGLMTGNSSSHSSFTARRPPRPIRSAARTQPRSASNVSADESGRLAHSRSHTQFQSLLYPSYGLDAADLPVASDVELGVPSNAASFDDVSEVYATLGGNRELFRHSYGTGLNEAYMSVAHAAETKGETPPQKIHTSKSMVSFRDDAEDGLLRESVSFTRVEDAKLNRSMNSLANALPSMDDVSKEAQTRDSYESDEKHHDDEYSIAF